MKQNENTKYVKLGITGASVLAFGFAIMYILNQSQNIASGIRGIFNILKPFLYGALIAYILAPMCNRMDDRFLKWFPNATEKQKSTLSRVIIIIIGIVSIAICNFQPAVVDMVNWCFSFGIPVFIMGVIGLWWKRSTKASVITFIITWIVVCIWSTFGLQNALGWANFHVNYISLIVALIVGVISTAVLPGKKELFAGKRA